MPDVLLFGATGYTGRLTAHALARRNVDFAIAGRNRPKLEAVAKETGAGDVRIAAVGDAGTLTGALVDCRVLLTCVGPFASLGDTAVEAALRAGVHYLDSTGEGSFIERLVLRYDGRARKAGIAIAPAMGFDEVPADLAAAVASAGMEAAELTLTYAVPSSASTGTVRSALGILASKGPFVENGRQVLVGTAQQERWSPMPPPLGPKPAVSAPFAELHLAPLHLDLRDFRIFMTAGTLQRLGLKLGMPGLRFAYPLPGVNRALKALAPRVIPKPNQRTALFKRWTILAEARFEGGWRNVAVSGADVYGLTAHLLAAGAAHMAADDYDKEGVVSPVQSLGAGVLEKELIDYDVTMDTFEAS